MFVNFTMYKVTKNVRAWLYRRPFHFRYFVFDQSFDFKSLCKNCKQCTRVSVCNIHCIPMNEHGCCGQQGMKMARFYLPKYPCTNQYTSIKRIKIMFTDTNAMFGDTDQTSQIFYRVYITHRHNFRLFAHNCLCTKASNAKRQIAHV